MGLPALHYLAVIWHIVSAVDKTEDSPAYVPLVHLPVNMEKRISNGEYIFPIAGRDDGETANGRV